MKKFGLVGFLYAEEKHIADSYERLITRLTRTLLGHISDELEKPSPEYGVKVRKEKFDEARNRQMYRTVYYLLDIDEVEAIDNFMHRMETGTPDDLPDIAIDLWYNLKGWVRD